MAASNTKLNKAKQEKNDEFYTQLCDIENELCHYKEYFRDKVVLCNCDDPDWSNFFVYFSKNFSHLGIKKLISTHYCKDGKGHKLVIENKPGAPMTMAPIKTELKGDGDFRSAECIEILKEADIVVTNPPFSLFREYVAQLIEYDKKFIVIGNQNAIGTKGIFPLILGNKLWLGYGFKGSVGFFINHHYEDYAKASEHKDGMIRVSGVVWYTNIVINKRLEDFIAVEDYSELKYKKYDNYDAIDVPKTNLIPKDYMGEMGVPLTFINKYNPNQFEILSCSAYSDKNAYGMGSLYLDGIKQYTRIIIRRKNQNEN